MENLKGVELFPHPDELDRLTGDCTNRQGRTTAGITIHLGQDNASQRQLLIEARRHRHRILPGHSVSDKKDFLRGDRLDDPHELTHQLGVNMQTTGGIKNDCVETVELSVTTRPDTDVNRLFFH